MILTNTELLRWLERAERLAVARTLELDDAALAQLREFVRKARIKDGPDPREPMEIE